MRPTSLVLIGAGGFGREVAMAALASPAGMNDAFDVIGFLDDDLTRQGAVVGSIPVVGTLDDVGRYRDAHFVVTVGNPRDFAVRQRIVDRLDLPDDRFATVVHPGAHLSPTVEIGPGSVVLASAVATADVRVGAHVTVMPGVVLTHDDVVDDFAILASAVCLAGDVHVESGAYLGAGCLVREHLTIGARSLIGMGSVVLEDVGPGEIWRGVPARQSGHVVPPQR